MSAHLLQHLGHHEARSTPATSDMLQAKGSAAMFGMKVICSTLCALLATVKSSNCSPGCREVNDQWAIPLLDGYLELLSIHRTHLQHPLTMDGLLCSKACVSHCHHLLCTGLTLLVAGCSASCALTWTVRLVPCFRSCLWTHVAEALGARFCTMDATRGLGLEQSIASGWRCLQDSLSFFAS